MQQVGWNPLSNISVRAKLGLGFALLIGMILLVAYTGWSATDTLRDRSERMNDIAGYSSLARDMRIERLVYLTKADDAQAAKWLAALNKIEGQLQAIVPHFNSPVNKALLDETGTALKRYRDFYNQTITATREREAIRKVATSAAEAANAHLLTLAEAVNGETGRPADRQQLTALFIGVQRMRVDFRGYANAPGKDSEQTARNSVNDALTQAKALSATALPAETVQKLLGEISGYQQRLDQLAAAQARVDQAQGGITTTITTLLGIADKLTASQQEFRTADVAGARQLLLIWLAVAIALGLACAWLITRSIVKPLQDTVALAEQVANGDFTHQQQVTRKDELGALQTSMQGMTGNLRRLIGEVRDGVVQVASAAEQLSAVTEQTSAGVQSQKVETDQIATAMQEMTATTHEVARNAGDAAKSALEASRQALQGEQSVSKAVDQIEVLAREMESTKTAMATLRDHADSIGGVLDVIKAVSEQTNLLALNAAIEAARAGEAGRGFAVVADEVRGLAQRTRSSTDEIAQLITGLHQSTDRMATVLDHNVQLTESSVGLSREAGEMLKRITRSVKDIESMNEQIACAAEQQSSAGEEISRNVTNVRDISDQTAAASEETASSSMELARIGVRLQEMTARFKV
ncbi:methyl-accepting chemotaxis protein [Pseudomonas sp. 102515]|uniref:HAMP domain-containing methyl-accepting chemotaxis protein n=1 Tax=Pseudomonas sp. 102515 TaxID=3071568 RepID=UPI002802EE5C|nr:methyl-accepting chemotaxis protein [Pseudomonas sp. 102515]MDQ7913170.1 methyl-accepting chemotaxis protein [Pseudomonas sp. 102515]